MNSSRVPPRALVAGLLLCLLTVGTPLYAQTDGNPFTGGGPRERSEVRPPKDSGREADPTEAASSEDDSGTEAGVRRGIGARLRGLFPVSRELLPEIVTRLELQQRQLHARIGSLLRLHGLRTTPDSSGVLGHDAASDAPETSEAAYRGLGLIGVVSFLYGMVHAALPGHRKVLLVSYFVSQPAPIRHGVMAGIGVAILHSATAVAIILGAYFFIEGAVSTALDTSGAYLNVITAAMVLLLGIAILGSKVSEVVSHLRARRQPSPENAALGDSHDHNGEEGAGIVKRLQGRVGLLPAIVLSAVIPCPGSALIMMFALSLDAITVGIYAVVVFSVGMALTLSIVSVIAIVLKRATLRSFDGAFGEVLHIGVETLGAVVLVLFGVSLLAMHL